MNPITDFDRLESMGLWRSADARQRREVVVSFGKSTLVLTDMNNNPLAHWSLASIHRVGSGETGTIFSADPDGAETLEIDDPTMIAAISKIRASIEATRPHPGRLRIVLRIAGLLALIAIAAFWLPSRVKSYAANVLPIAKADEISATLITQMEQVTGPECRSQSGNAALTRLATRVLPVQPPSLHVMKLGSRPSLRLPNGGLILNHKILQQTQNTEIAAGLLLNEYRLTQTMPIARDLFKDIGLGAVVRFLSRGEISRSKLDIFTKKLLFNAPDYANTDQLAQDFFEAQIPHQRFARFAGLSELANKPETTIDTSTPILTDQDWLAILEICNG